MTQDPGGSDLLRRFTERRVRIQSALTRCPGTLAAKWLTAWSIDATASGAKRLPVL
ncbi:2-dehydropantoate 2-reductase [Ralstonia solanacearum]|nr:2-dehydropantoate 2-reductase [Ralstonia solanacearum]